MDQQAIVNAFHAAAAPAPDMERDALADAIPARGDVVRISHRQPRTVGIGDGIALQHEQQGSDVARANSNNLSGSPIRVKLATVQLAASNAVG
jgi:hypothetical protein